MKEKPWLNKPWPRMTIGELHFAWAYWNYLIETAGSWGSSLTLADHYRRQAEEEIKRRFGE